MGAADGESAKALLAFGWLMATLVLLRYTGMKLLALAARNIRSSASSETEMPRRSSKQLVVCLKNEGYPASLERRKIYVAVRDLLAEKHGLLRVIDESGDDYLYPKALFRPIALPQSVRRAVLAAD
jgi:hypothetical protein